ncbi:DUF1672 family protein [Rossellomorea marisflavi]|uniref:DUF1672 family protein n=1 Tax=Rossellomorea marisflavi TaxID=189381 RepID=UPI00064E5493|nr:DUF1672 family protein [Rossellomorea marisflavi]VXC25692.1 conserved hypothetical protein [Bacillus sp. 349Y]KMK94808.1 hypothetical protein VL03_08350 [Rossellomorea marisflavi]MCM2605793.1 DUF1672 domain-containing protein [Rossellomorea marisflavi]TYO71306.1 DUF1672 family protein [Rossellomorea marisflavi]USK93374.1 DUF1672 domain-containing protein [Rossellomorea marisflavi]
MKHKWKLFVCGISISLLLGGCFGVDSGKKSEAKKTDTKQGELDRPEDVYESVLTYTGEGMYLPNGEKNEKIAKAKEDEVIAATENYIKENYHVDVKVNNMVGNKDGVTVFFESLGRLHFYSTAIVPIDSSTGKVAQDKVFTLSKEVEDSIRAALYAYIMEEEFHELDLMLKELKEDNDIVGRTEEAVANSGGLGYETPYYFIQSVDLDEAINPVYELFMKDPNASQSELKEAYLPDKFKPENLTFSIQFYMNNKDSKPNKDIFNKIVEAVENNQKIPYGAYSIDLHDNYIIKKNGEGYKENSLSRSVPDEIIKNR